jgi:hypothetical protein
MIVAQGVTLSAYSVGLAARALAILPNVRDNRVPMSGYPFSKREPIGTSVHHIVICCGLPK